jgi:4-aminobutyrate aminotransferase-like enzyme
MEYLDCVNNISHVGHSHIKIHDAMVKQNLKLNTNTRYLYKIINDYSNRLLNKFPKELDTIFFVCTGSEANDLAYRIAQNYTNSKDVIVMDNAYHGHTNTLIDLSPYKFKGRGGLGKKDYVHIADMPDGLRGKWRYSEKNWVKKYILQVQSTIDNIYKNNGKLSCFFVESILGCGGQVVLPPKYLMEVFKIIKKKNALCIVDEVQTGFGRVGSHFWGFEEHGIIPDIVTLGKPMGNGHPIAAVVTTKKIANKFNNGMEYFNSFGGNPVSCAIGNAVLDVIEDEKLQNNAQITGKYFLESLNNIRLKFPQFISEIRGKGLFIGIDLIKNNNNFPNDKLATFIVNKMREKGILLSTDGPYHNVIKIKPPMTFNYNNVDLVCYELIKIFKNLIY